MGKKDQKENERLEAVLELLRKQTPLTVKQEKFCNNACVERFLNAKGDNVKEAAMHLRACLSWRDNIGTGHLIADEFSAELADGVAYVAGHDEESRPIMIFRIKQDYQKFHSQKLFTRLLVFTLEVAIGTMPRNAEQFVLLFDATLIRYEAASWLRKMVGVVGAKDLPAQPSEEDFRLGLRSGIILCNAINKVQPGAVPKVVEGLNDTVVVADGAALSTYQYFENAQNFLVVEGPGDAVVVADGAALCAYQYFENVQNFLIAVEEMGLPTFEASDLEQGGKSSRIVNCVLVVKSYSDWKQGGGNGSWKFGGNLKPTVFGKHIARKNSEPFMNSFSRNLPTNEKSLEGLSSEQYLSGHDLSEMSTSGSLNTLVRAVLSDKKQEEIPIIVESMLSKVMEEFERRFASQNE